MQAASLWPSQPPPNFIEDVFSCFLYTGTGAAQTITNGINLSGKGGLVWSKARNISQDHSLIDTVRGNGSILYSNLTSAADTGVTVGLTAFNATGYSLGTGSFINQNNQPYVSWTFREQPKFFDVVTYTGNGTAGRQISHNLGSVPGCIILKSTSEAGVNWNVFHRSIAPTGTLRLNLSDAQTSGLIEYYFGNDTAYVAPTSSVFTVGGSGAGNQVNGSGATYVAYLFAHDAGGFGLTETDNVISCGSFTTDGSGNATVNLGYEPQWVMLKSAVGGAGDWRISDTMRNMSLTGNLSLRPNLSNAEQDLGAGAVKPTAIGFTTDANITNANWTYIYIAIRRGPMKVPTVGTTVFSPNQTSGTTGTPITTGFPIDWQILGINAGNGSNQRVSTRLTGVNTDGSSNSQLLITSSTAAEAATGSLTLNWGNTGFQVPSLNSGSPIITWNFGRAPGFHDVVCYTGTGSATTLTHNLAAVPEMMIVKWRTGATGSNWSCYHSALGNTQVISLNEDSQSYTASQWNNTTPTSTVFSVGTQDNVNGSAKTYVAYLFATCAGVSKVGSYTGNAGYTVTVPCGFTAGVRFVLIKRTDSTGDWYVWDSARGIVAGNDPYLLLNSTAAEVTGTDYVDTYSAGFEISSTAPAGINASAGTYIFLAIA